MGRNMGNEYTATLYKDGQPVELKGAMS
jgi:hypothetical protein